MIIVRLAGGLGNQIFQFGVALSLAKKNNINKIIIDDSNLSKYTVKRKNELINFFNLDKLDIEVSFEYKFITKLRIPKIFPIRIGNILLLSDKNFELVKNNEYKHIIMDGYFQWVLSQEDFDEIVNFLKKIFISNNLDYYKEGCIIHIRGGDFIKLGWNRITSKEYYIKAIKYMKDKYHQDKFYVVTDDKRYSKTLLKGLDVEYKFIGGDMYEDFYLIGSFQYRILSSSTFALWASALGNNEKGFVIAPDYWFINKRRIIYLPNEVRISL